MNIKVLGAENDIEFQPGEKTWIVDGSHELRNFHVREGADVRILKLFKGEESGDCEVNVEVESGAKVETTVVHVGNRGGKLNVIGNVRDSDAVSDIKVLYFADNADGLKVRVRNDFHKRDSSGNITVKGVVANKAKVEIFGEIGIAQTAGGTDSSLDQHALICGKGSRVRQLPILEINTNDVKAAHGATVSKVQDADLFYFLSRGISKDIAFMLSVNGFLASLLGDIEDFGEHYDSMIALLEERTRRLVA